MYVVVIRNETFGRVVVGPFKDEEKAEEWGKTLRHSEWRAAPVVKPHKEWDEV